MLVPLKFELMVLISDGGLGGTGSAGGVRRAKAVVGLAGPRSDLCDPLDAMEEYATPPFALGTVEEDSARNSCGLEKVSRPPGGSTAWTKRV